MVTKEEAVYIAGKKARKLNMPWGIDVKTTRRRLWPFAGTWVVVSRVPAEFSQTMILVNARTGIAYPRRVLVEKRFGVGGGG